MTREAIERGVYAVAAVFARHGLRGPDHDPSPIQLARQWTFGLANGEPRGPVTADLYEGVNGRLVAIGCSSGRATRQAMVVALQAIVAWDVAVAMADDEAERFAGLIYAGVSPQAAREQVLHGTVDSMADAAQDAECRVAETGERHGVVRDGDRYRVVPVLYVAELPDEGEEDAAVQPRSRFDVFGELCAEGWDPDEAAVAAGGTGRP